MGNIGQLRTEDSIDKAMRTIREWLERLGISGLNIQTQYDAKQNIALVKFRYKNKDYEFRSTKQTNCRLNMHGIARVMEFKVRASIMGIEDFETSMKSYLQIENKSGITSEHQVTGNEINYIKLGITSLASNDEIKKRYNLLMKSYHPDMIESINSDEAKKEFQKKASEINEAYTEIKKERGLINSE